MMPRNEKQQQLNLARSTTAKRLHSISVFSFRLPFPVSVSISFPFPAFPYAHLTLALHYVIDFVPCYN